MKSTLWIDKAIARVIRKLCVEVSVARIHECLNFDLQWVVAKSTISLPLRIDTHRSRHLHDCIAIEHFDTIVQHSFLYVPEMKLACIQGVRKIATETV